MGDRNNPIKFGPEWLRNLARERSAGSSSSNSQNVAGTSGTTGPGASGTSGGGTASSSTAATGTGNTANAGPKVLLAKLRYGREEMLALYDSTSEAPQELRTIDSLYQPRGKPPVALNNTFEDDMVRQRDTMRGPPGGGGMAPGERFGIGRGVGRGVNVNEPGREVRGRGTRLALLRQSYGARGIPWNGGLRMPGYSGGADDEPPASMRSWNNGSNGSNAAVRNSGDLIEWTPNKMFRTKRPGHNTNWRTPTRDDNEEWRSSEAANRPRTSQQDKWERDWGDRPTQDKPQWNNRRQWVGGDSQSNNDDNLPEWATDGSEACGGTFDSSGAFHGYSNDDSNLPKNQETPYTLTRSNTHGSFARSKTVEEGSDEWWASEKAKKLSPKRFDASEIKFKKLSPTSDASATASSSAMTTSSKLENPVLKTVEKPNASAAVPDTPDSSTSSEDGFTKKSVRFAESKTFDSLMRSGDINLEEANDRGNFQSVMITPNNSLRQKHQNIVQAVSSNPTGKKQKPAFELLQLFQNSTTAQNTGGELSKQQTTEEKIVDELIELTLEDRKLNQAMPAGRGKLPSSSSMSQGMPTAVNSTSKMSNQGMQLNMSNPMQMAMNSKPNISSAGMQSQGMQTQPPRMQIQQPGMQMQKSGLQMQPSGMELPSPVIQMQSPVMQMQSPGIQMQPAGMHMQSPGMQMQSTGIQIQSPGMQIHSPGMQMLPSGMQMQPSAMQMQSSGMQIPSPGLQMQSSGLQMHGSGMPMQSSGIPIQSSGMPGITNSALNASLGLPHGVSNNTIGQSMGMPLQGAPAPVLPNQGMTNSGMSVGDMHTVGAMQSFQSSSVMQGMSSSNVANNSLFLGQNTNNASMQSSGDIPMPNHGNQSNMYPMHGLQHSNSGTFPASIYGNMMTQTPVPTSSNSQDLNDQWYYEDPKQIIQGPFSSKDMYTWYSAGFFSPSLMVRRACDAVLRPLASYGPVVPFAQMDMLSYPMSGGFDSHNQGPQQGLGLDVVNMPKINQTNPMQFVRQPVGIMNQPYRQQQMVDSMWSQPTNPSELMWMQQAMNSRNETCVNNLPMFFWDQQPSAIGSNALLPEEITKEMKTEDQILAQLRASQNTNSPQNMHFRGEPPASSANKSEESYPSKMDTPNLEELQKLLQKDTLKEISFGTEPRLDSQESQMKSESDEQNAAELNNAKPPQAQSKATADAKLAKQVKSEPEKAAKTKESTAKSKSKKTKDDKKEDSIENKNKEDEIIMPEKRSENQSPPKIKKEDKPNKKEQEKEKKDWIKEKDGFTVVKGVDKSASKDIKKKAEEVKAAEDTERKRKEEERLVAEEEKKKNKVDAIKKQQELQQQQQQRQASESVNKKAPWSAVSSQANLVTSKEGLTLSEIQRLEREKKLEQMKEQQQMMQIIAQQQAAALAREQEMQAGLGWAKKKGTNSPGQSLSEIQAEARKQAAADVAAASAAQVLEEAQPASPPMQVNHVPWGNAHNGGGFWDTQPNQPIAQPQVSSPQKVEPIKKKKITLSLPVKKETSPAADFETWCTTVLTSWSTKIDVPTFVGFLKDIESPYEVKDYVKCYLGESKDTGDFARQFLERRSKLLRVGMVTPSDDLCSPAIAVNPRTNSGSEYQEVKGKGKKTKKNKMVKLDARILGFSVTAAEDRINVGDIDTA